MLQILKAAIDDGNFDREEIKDFQFCKHELTYVGDVLVRGKLIIVPKSLRDRFLQLAHEGHLGEAMMKRRLRSRCWFPKIDNQVEKFVKACRECLLVSAPVPPEPLSRRKLPSNAFVDVAIDFLGPLPSGEFLLVIVDYFSRWMNVKIMTTITAEATIDRLEEIFFDRGYPVTITLDNGRQFISTKFKEYCNEHKIYLNHTAPYWPQANGEVERQNRTLLKRLKIGNSSRGEWKTELRRFLIAYNSTPHSVTNKSPNELMGRELRTKIPSLGEVETIPMREEIVERDWQLKTKGKERADELRKAKSNDIKIGDKVVQKNLIKDNKLTTTFDRKEFEIIDRQGPVVTLANDDTGEKYDRIVTHVKKIPENETNSNVPDSRDDLECVDSGVTARPRRPVKLPARYQN